MQGAGKVDDPEREILSRRQTEGQTDWSMRFKGGLETELEGVGTEKEDKREISRGGR